MISELELKALEKILNDVYTNLNKIKFNNELPPLPVIPVTGAEFLGSCRATNGRPTRILISIDKLPRGPGILEELAAAILHEMIHAYCYIHGIPHYNPKTGEHLPGFIKAAEDHGLFYDNLLYSNFLLFDYS